MSEAQRDVCEGLAKLFPTATILLLTRGIRSFLLSGYSQAVRGGRSEDFYALPLGRSDFLSRARDHWNYDYLISLYEKAFGGRLIVLPYELLKDDPAAFVAELEAALGLDPAVVPLDVVYPALSGFELRWYPRITRAVLRLPLGRRLRRHVLKMYVRSVDQNSWAPLIRLLQRFFPITPVTADLVRDQDLGLFQGRADLLSRYPLYAPYADEYLLGQASESR